MQEIIHVASDVTDFASDLANAGMKTGYRLLRQKAIKSVLSSGRP